MRMTKKLTRKKTDKPSKKKVILPYNPNEPVKAYMTRNPICVSPDTGVKTAFKLLQAKGFKQLLVTDKGKLTGIVTDRDFRKPQFGDKIETWQEYYRISDLHKIRDIKTSNVVTINENTHLIDAVGIFEKKKFNALPVLSDAEKLVGILTVYDILSSLISSHKGVEGSQKNALKFLSKLYSLCKVNQSKQFDLYEIGKKLRYNATETNYIVETLSRAELIRYEKSSNKVAITTYGIMVAKGEITVGYAPIL
jgi:acetoin utilization protein AcuB